MREFFTGTIHPKTILKLMTGSSLSVTRLSKNLTAKPQCRRKSALMFLDSVPLQIDKFSLIREDKMGMIRSALLFNRIKPECAA